MIGEIEKIGISGRDQMMMWCQLGLTVGATWSMTHSIILRLVGHKKKKKKKKKKKPNCETTTFSSLILAGSQEAGEGGVIRNRQSTINYLYGEVSISVAI